MKFNQSSKLLFLSVLFLVVCFAFAKEHNKKKSDSVIRNSFEKRDASCPNQCSSHGTCENGLCRCEKHWSGADCSYADEELLSGEPMNGTITLGRWQYYHINLAASSNLNLWVNESSRWSDCDIYVQRNAYPTRSVFQYSSTSSQSNSHLVINGALVGNWIIGVYGFSFTRCNFVIQVDVSSVCTTNCSGHGSCIAGECVCDPGWTKSDCSGIQTALENGWTSQTITVKKWQWMYFTVNITSPSSYLKVTVQASSGDPDVYLKRGKVPSTFSWDALNVTTGSVSTILIQTPIVDAYYVGVFGFTESAFTISAEFPSGATLTCPSQCSNHGSCDATNVCQCNVGYNGFKCQNGTTPLVIGNTVSGYVAQNDWNNYYIQYTTSNAIRFHFEQSGDNDDCDVYIKKQVAPTRYSFDQYSISAQNTFDVTIPNPASYTWYIGVFGWKNCTYTFVPSIAACDCSTLSSGSCSPASGSTCVCHTGWTGVDCTSPLHPIANAESATNVVTLDSWVFYSFTVTSSNVAITVKETSSTGFLWVYVAQNPDETYIAPTLDSSTYEEKSTSLLHNIFISNPSAQRNTYIIGVYGNPYNPAPGIPSPFEIAVYGTNF